MYAKLLTLALIAIFIIIGCTTNSQENQAFLSPPQVIEDPGYEHSNQARAFQGIPSLAISPNGRMWATWYAGKTAAEDSNNYVVVSTSGDNGLTWKETHVVDPDGEGQVRAFDPELWLDPNGKLWSFWAQHIGGNGTISGVWTMRCDNPDSENPTWTQPRRLFDGIMMCKPTVLSSGDWLFPASTWAKTDNSAKVRVSTDQGASWELLGAAHVPQEVRTYDEHMVVERKDGSLWMLVRTKYGIGQSVSTDRGKTWKVVEPSAIQHPSARFFIRRLLSGNLLLVKHGPINDQTKRSHLTAFISKDDGQTWQGGLILDEREGVSYPDGQQTADGKIYIIYDFDRRGAREILIASFEEKDILSGDSNSESVNLRQLVCKATLNK